MDVKELNPTFNIIKKLSAQSEVKVSDEVSKINTFMDIMLNNALLNLIKLATKHRQYNGRYSHTLWVVQRAIAPMTQYNCCHTTCRCAVLFACRQ